MRVLVHSLVFPPDGVSTAALVGRLAREIASSGHEVTAVTTTPHYNVDHESRAEQPMERRWWGLVRESRYHGVRVLHVRVSSGRRRGWWRLLDYAAYHLFAIALSLSSRGPWDVILATTPPPSVGAVALLTARLLRVPLVYNVQELFPDVLAPAGLDHPIARNVVGRIERTVYHHADAVVGITQDFARAIVDRGADPERAQVIPNFAETDRIHPMPRSRSRFAQEHGLGTEPVVLYAGNLGTTQDFETVLDAAERLDGAIRLVLVGDGVRRGWLAEEIERRRLPGVLLLPYQPRSLVTDVYGASDLCLVPLKTEAAGGTFPSKIYTIMASGRPALVVAEPESSLAELVRESRCGWVVAPGDPDAVAETIRAACADPAELMARGRAGLERVAARHTPQAAAASYLRLMGELTKRQVPDGAGRPVGAEGEVR